MSKKYLLCKTITPLPKNCIVISDNDSQSFTFITGVVAVEETDSYIFLYDETDRISHVFDKSEGNYIEEDCIDNGMSFYDRLLLDKEEYESRKKQYVPEECSNCPYFGYDDDEDYKGLQHCLFRKLRGDYEIAPCDEDDFDILEVEDYDDDGDFMDEEDD